MKKPTPKDIQDLSLDSLLSGLDTTALASKARSPKKSLDLRNREAREEAEHQAAVERHRWNRQNLSPWLAESAILCMIETACSNCHSTYRAPAAETLLVRFKNRRDGSIWETANHPCQMNPDLPREVRTIQATVHVCPCCFQQPGATQHYFHLQQEEQSP